MKKVLLLIVSVVLVANITAQKNFVGTQAPKLFVEKWISEKPASIDGKYILIDFWATWCGPCIKAIPHMNEIAKKHSDKLVCIALSQESEDKVKGFKKATIEYYSAIDTKARTATACNVTSIPTIFIISPEQVVVWTGHPSELTDLVLASLLK